MCRRQSIDDVNSGGEKGGISGEAAFISQGCGQMSLSQANTAHEDDVASFFEERKAQEVLHLGPIDFLGPGPIELFEGFDDGEASARNAALGGPIFSAQGFSFGQAAQKVQLGPVFLHRFFGQAEMVFLKIGEFEVEQIGHEGVFFDRFFHRFGGVFLES